MRRPRRQSHHRYCSPPAPPRLLARRLRASPRALARRAYKTAGNTWSARVRRKGADIFLSGFTSQGAIEQELNERVAALAQRGKPGAPAFYFIEQECSRAENAPTFSARLVQVRSLSLELNCTLQVSRIAQISTNAKMSVANETQCLRRWRTQFARRRVWREMRGRSAGCIRWGQQRNWCWRH